MLLGVLKASGKVSWLPRVAYKATIDQHLKRSKFTYNIPEPGVKSLVCYLFLVLDVRTAQLISGVVTDDVSGEDGK